MFLPSLPDVIARPVSKGAELLRSSTASLAWGPLLGVSRSTVLGLLSRVETGTLLLTDEPTGRRHVFGQRPGPPQSTAAAEAEGGVNGDSHGSLPPNISDGKRRPTTVPRVELVVKRDAFWVRVLLFADMGFAEAYMLGEVECADLTAFFQVGGGHPYHVRVWPADISRA